MAVNAKRENRIKGIVDRVSNEDHYDDVAWITQAPVQVFCRSAVDETAQANAELHNDLGLQAKIRRQTVGENCKWCDNLAGEYDYPGVPQEVFQRHDDCDCIVEYLPGDGSVQNVWSKEWVENPDDISERIRHNVGAIKPKITGEELEKKIDSVISERELLEREAYNLYMAENINTLGFAETDYRFRSLVSSNTDAQLRKFIKNAKKRV